MKALDGFVTTLPANVQSGPGVFVIARYQSRASLALDLLYCAEADNMRDAAGTAVKARSIDGFTQSLLYFVKPEASQEKRTALLAALTSAGIPGPERKKAP